MARIRRLSIHLPDALLQEVARAAGSSPVRGSRWMRQALIVYVRETQRHRLRQALVVGYQEMAALNLQLAEEDLCDSLISEYEEELVRAE